jgi:hypothetical protein
MTHLQLRRQGAETLFGKQSPSGTPSAEQLAFGKQSGGQLPFGGQADNRVLPVYYSDNYVSLVPGESRTITIEVARADLKGQSPLIAMDGWNIDVNTAISGGVKVMLNSGAQVSSWPVTGLPIDYGNPANK